ncbi:pentatricopeptide repeat-containing protein At3g14580, mitochondrial isoform X2 [Magnolia sinica]|uniref:pentatricopeptide repeat-containing protein At3g14580, mitochondrial isoform X2 n=1 Tax=Magnolia sinica TaxID=86752 RepID=UPI00265A8A07|nr:pentatricopeptide repeat-containing protein At3g14580, mitochondrial isoform X2 [Magnolia sinica]
MMAHLVVSRKKEICLKMLQLAMVDLVTMKCLRCVVTSSSSMSSKISYPLEDTGQLRRLDHKDWLAPNEVLKIFKTLKDPELIISVFKKVSERKDYKPNEALYSLMIEKLARARNFDAIEEILGRIKSENCRISEEFFYRLIKLYGNVASNPEQAIKTLFRMPDFHCWPTIKTFNFILNMLVNAKQFDVIHEGCKPNTKTYSTLMHSLCKHDRVSEAFELLERMEKKGCHPDTITFNILISGLCKQRKVAEGLELLHKMKLKGCKPNSGSYQTLLYGLLSSGDFVKAKHFVSQMLSEGIFPSFLSYKLLIDGLCNQNLLNDVDFVLKQMVHQGFIPRMGTWKKILESMVLRKDCYSYLADNNNLMQSVN